MAEKTKIAWTDSTFNPWIGCTKVGPGCDHCYAEAFAKRTGKAVWGNDVPRLQTKGPWKEVVKWERESAAFFAEHGRKRRVFCASLADVFDNQVEQMWRDYVWEIMAACPNLNFQIVTKRIGNLEKMIPEIWRGFGFPQNVGVMSTIVNQQEADRDIPKLLKAKADFNIPWVGLSMEPLLAEVQVAEYLPNSLWNNLPSWKQPELDWIIVGGESGSKWRKMRFEWAYSLMSQAKAAGVPFFFKQVSDLHPTDAMIESELRVREYPEALR